MAQRSACVHCGRQHSGECRKLTGGCFFCGSLDHMLRDCPEKTRVTGGNGGRTISEPTVGVSAASGIGATSSRGRGRGRTTATGRGISRSEGQSFKPQTQARVFAMTRKEAIDAPEVVTGKILIHGLEAYALIDPGSTHSFISLGMASRLCKKHEPLGFDLNVSTPLGEIVRVNNICRDCLVYIDKAELEANLILLPLREFDVILGMDWLTKHHAIVNCFTKKVIIESPNQPRVMFLGKDKLYLRV